MTVKTSELEGYEVLKGLSPELMEVIASLATYEDFESGYSLTFEGTEADCFFLLEEGRVNILTEKWDDDLPEGQVMKPIQTLTKGDVLGWSWIVDPYVWSFTATAVTVTKTIRVDGTKLREYLEENPKYGFELLKRFMRMLKDRLIATRMHLALNNGIPFRSQEGG